MILDSEFYNLLAQAASGRDELKVLKLLKQMGLLNETAVRNWKIKKEYAAIKDNENFDFKTAQSDLAKKYGIKERTIKQILYVFPQKPGE